MNYKATVTIDDPALFDIIAPDLKSDKRAKITPKKTATQSKFIINAKDPVALRASMNTLAKSFIIFEKVGKLK